MLLSLPLPPLMSRPIYGALVRTADCTLENSYRNKLCVYTYGLYTIFILQPPVRATQFAT